jgi:hypothetical protein
VTTIVSRVSSTPGAVPTAGALSLGELCVNAADGMVFLKRADGTIGAIGDTLAPPTLTTGTPTAYVLTPAKAIGAYRAGQIFVAILHVANGANATMAVSGVGAKALMVNTGGVLAAPAAGTLPAGMRVAMIYDGTRLVLLDDPWALNGDNTSTLLRVSPAMLADAIARNGWQFASGGTPTPFAGQNSYTFTGIPSTATEISVMTAAMLGSSSQLAFLQIGSGSVVTTGYNYCGSIAFSPYNNLPGFILDDFSAPITSICTIRRMGTTNTYVCNIVGGQGSDRAISGAGWITISGPLDRVRLVPYGNATFNSVSFIVAWR